MTACSRLATATLVAFSSVGCALTSKSDSVILHYFTPERVMSRAVAAAAPPASASNLSLRLGRVSAATYLRERIAFRDSDYEVGYYDDLRWTERPDAYVRRAMVRGLFEDQPIRQVISGPGPTLDIELNAFEELRIPRHAARVEITWILHDDQAVVLQKTRLVERTISAEKSSTSAGAVATAMSEALGEAVKTAVTDIVVVLSNAPAAQGELPTAKLREIRQP